MFIPWVFTFGAELEGLSNSEFLEDPTKLSNALRSIHNYFQADGVVCSGDVNLLAEVLGSRLPSQKSSTESGTLKKLPEDFEEHLKILPQTSPIAVALEVTKRLNILLPETLFLSVIPGPVTLARQLTRQTLDEVCADSKLLGTVSKAVLVMTKALGDAGTDLLIVHEDALPPLNKAENSQVDISKILHRSYTPIWNTAKFYELSPMLMLKEWLPENEEILNKLVNGIVYPAKQLSANKVPNKVIAVSIPASLMEKTPEEIQQFLDTHGVSHLITTAKLSFLTTDSEIPQNINKEYMIRSIKVLRDVLKKRP
ncbi:MAG: hypothetical protein QGH79_00760 [SAR324 cluster bacterium]|nr:hypothetical protein [SAR324 cluster bacterium]MDP6743064.1 hypothetical protein [SAR324 cluster bacterium]MDP7045768.1 hypothetical protein [SAR324 cluster bacterium]